MSKQARGWLAGVAVCALALGLFATGLGRAGGGDLKADIQKVAKAFAKGDAAEAKQLAQGVGKSIEELHEMMDLMRPRTKKGLGVGAKAGVVTPDGIELKLIALGRDAPGAATLNKEAKALEEMGYVVAAIGEITAVKAPAKDKGKQKKSDWVEWSNDMRDGALELAKAAKSKSAQNLKMAAAKVNNSCNSCHSVFRD